jgi:hypothetical protein
MITLVQLIGNLSIVVATSCLYFSFAWLYFAARLFKNFDIQSKWPMIFFATTFAIACSMFQLIIFEILGILDETYEHRRPLFETSTQSSLVFVSPWSL